MSEGLHGTIYHNNEITLKCKKCRDCLIDDKEIIVYRWQFGPDDKYCVDCYNKMHPKIKKDYIVIDNMLFE